MVEAAAGQEVQSGLTVAVGRQTEGNPLFVTEMIRMLPGEALEKGQDFFTSIPEGVRDAIGRRLNQLSEGCNQVLTTASVIGREFELRQLAPLVEDISEDRLLEVLEEALGARVIEELPQALGRYQFTHALIQETLSEELTLTRPVNRAAMKRDADGYMAECALTEAERELVRNRDYLGMIEAGGNIYLIMKLGAVNGDGLYQMGAQQRGQTYEEFLATRNASGAR